MLSALARLYNVGVTAPHIALLVGAALRPEAPGFVLGGHAEGLAKRLAEAGCHPELRTGGLALSMPSV